eukprot:gb/GFBE01005501.1/.p1 GENE.gb/GFBE01005501.1/~~gb/GFBE01005501.1/.p1  ORF type:complete len:128 (+),score=23.73 gb/GFBE01005501.1/:1-384(+)
MRAWASVLLLTLVAASGSNDELLIDDECAGAVSDSTGCSLSALQVSTAKIGEKQAAEDCAAAEKALLASDDCGDMTQACRADCEPHYCAAIQNCIPGLAAEQGAPMMDSDNLRAIADALTQCGSKCR